MKISYIEGGRELLEIVKPLWEKLNEHHGVHSTFFSDGYKKNTFVLRRKKFEGECTIALKVELAVDEEVNRHVGYCISTISRDMTGEIDSLFVDGFYRNSGIGEELMKRGLGWLDKKGAKNIKIGVAVGNEDVLNFYRRFGFYPRTIVLERKD